MSSDQKQKAVIDIPSQGLTCQIHRFDSQTMMVSMTDLRTKESYQRSISVKEIILLFIPIKGHPVPKELSTSTKEFFEFLEECLSAINNQGKSQPIKTKVEMGDKVKKCNIICDINEEDCKLSINISLPFRDISNKSTNSNSKKSGVDKKVEKASSKVKTRHIKKHIMTHSLLLCELYKDIS